MKSNKPVAWACIASLLSGCTSLAVHRLDPASTSREGIAYALPFTQYSVTMTWRVVDCHVQVPGRPDQARIAVKAEATVGQADDARHQYLIDPSSLQGLLNRSEFNATFQEDSNMLKGVNVTIEDRTGPFIGNIVRTAVALAPLVAGVPPLPVPGAAPPPPPPRCLPATEVAVALVNTLKGQLDDINREVAAATEAVTVIAASVAQLGEAVDDATAARYGAAVQTLADLRSRQATLAARLADALKPITFQRTVRWPSDGGCFATLAPYSIDQGVLDRWFGVGTDIPDQPRVHLAIERTGSAGREPSGCPAAPAPGVPVTPGPGEPADNARGLRYRMAAHGRLVACTVSPCRSSLPSPAVLLAVEGPVAQLGHVNLLPVRNRAFGSTTFAAEFRPNGSLSSAGYAQKAAPLEAGSETLASAATSLAPLFDPTQQLTRDTAYLTALKAQRDALAAVTPAQEDPTATSQAAIEADTSLLNARIAQLEAQITLARLQASRPPQ